MREREIEERDTDRETEREGEDGRESAGEREKERERELAYFRKINSCHMLLTIHWYVCLCKLCRYVICCDF